MSDLDPAAREALVAEHYPYQFPNPRGVDGIQTDCAKCDQTWPCPTQQLLAAYDAAVAERDAARMVAKALYDPADIAAKFCHGRPDGLTYSEWCELCPALVALENALGLADEQMPDLKEN